MSVNHQHGISCVDCWASGTECDLEALNEHSNFSISCLECTEAGSHCCIPVSDAPLLKLGLHTAVDGKRKCLNCFLESRSCSFPSGQRPNPCLACIKKGVAGCRIPPAPTESYSQTFDSSVYTSVRGGSVAESPSLRSVGMTSVDPWASSEIDCPGAADMEDANDNGIPLEQYKSVFCTPGGRLDTEDPDYQWLKNECGYTPGSVLTQSAGMSEQLDSATVTGEATDDEANSPSPIAISETTPMPIPTIDLTDEDMGGIHEEFINEHDVKYFEPTYETPFGQWQEQHYFGGGEANFT